jgi:hypothetical protein
MRKAAKKKVICERISAEKLGRKYCSKSVSLTGELRTEPKSRRGEPYYPFMSVI